MRGLIYTMAVFYVACLLSFLALIFSMGCSLIVDGEKEDDYESYLDDSDYDEDTSGGIGSHDDSLGGTDTGVATSIDSVSSTQVGTGVVEETVSETISEADTVSASESISSSASGTGVETTSEVTSESVSETVPDSDTEHQVWCDDKTGLCWEWHNSEAGIPPEASYATMKLRCERQGMRIPTSPEVATLVVNCDGLFPPDCEYDGEGNGYSHCFTPGSTIVYDLQQCWGVVFLDMNLYYSHEWIMTSSAPALAEGRHEQWFLSREPDGPVLYPHIYQKTLNSGPGWNTICVK